uniref:Zinc/iron permease n=1 Tax=Syphacia muris TaxID=451379 RepID=A0A0N5A7V2_9BILA
MSHYEIDDSKSQQSVIAEILFQKFSKFFENDSEVGDKPKLWQTWGIGLLIVTISAFASPAGILLTPLLNKKLYERIMIFLVALGIGALSGSILYIMLPQAFRVTDDGEQFYLVKASIVLGALYGFFFIDRLLQFMVEIKRVSYLLFVTINTVFLGWFDSDDGTVSVAVTLVDEVVVDPEELQIASVAYMIIFGSSANNFVDGMSNGVAFADSLVRGLSVGLACIAQQFPQELGTLAILISSGLGLKRTLILNLIPAVLSYIGFVLGAVLDNNLEGTDDYVFAISSGMYSYVFLGTLIPEIRDSTNQLIKKNFREGIIATLLQCGGMLFGVIFMFCMFDFQLFPTN